MSPVAELDELDEKLKLDRNIFDILDESLESLKNLSKLNSGADIEGRHYIIGSIFPEKFDFDGTIDRTSKMNLAFELIYHINNRLEGKKNRVGSKKRTNSNQVPRKRFELLTHGLENRCSIQLSYRGIPFRSAKDIKSAN